MRRYKKNRNGYILTHMGYRDVHNTGLPEDLLTIARTGVDWSDMLATCSSRGHGDGEERQEIRAVKGKTLPPMSAAFRDRTRKRPLGIVHAVYARHGLVRWVYAERRLVRLVAGHSQGAA